MSAERKTADGVPAAQARATLFSRSTLIRIVARFGLLGVLVLLGILAAFISATFLRLSNGARLPPWVALGIGVIGRCR